MRYGGRQVVGLFLAVANLACAGQRLSPVRGPTARPPLLRAEAADRIAALPEFVAFGARVGQLAGGVVRAAIVGDGDGPVDGEWSFTACEDRDDHTARWNRLRVNAKTGEVRVERADGDCELLAARRAHPD